MSRPPQNPLSFKTVPGRNRTQKWQEAKTYNYDGDEWGGFDPYDEYGGYEEPPPPPSHSQNDQGPYPAPHSQRNNSFARGDDRRQVSANAAFPPFNRQEGPHSAGGSRSRSGGRRPSMENMRSRSRPRDFAGHEQGHYSPGAHGSPAPGERLPPRKSSLSTGQDVPEIEPVVPTPTEPQSITDKPLPFIRPSDIYKRMNEEKERRQSEESSRPSMDSIQRELDPSAAWSLSPTSRTLETVAESRESRLFMDEPLATQSASEQPSAVTEGRRGLNPANQSKAGNEPVPAPMAESQQNMPPQAGNTQPGQSDLHHHPSTGIRSAVHTAFDRSDGGMPSRDGSHSTGIGSSGVSRSDTNSTSGISPIMSRVPSAATAQQRQERIDTHVPPIAEEPAASPYGSKPTPGASMQSQQQHPLPSHNRNVSDEAAALAVVEPGYRRSLDPPSSGTSPARTPGLEDASNRRLSGPLAAETISEPSNGDPTAVSIANGGNDQDYSLRESDLAKTISSSPEKDDTPVNVAETERLNQESFLRTHTGTPTVPTSAITHPAGNLNNQTSDDRAIRDVDKFRNSLRQDSVESTNSSWSQFRDSDENMPRSADRYAGEGVDTRDAAAGNVQSLHDNHPSAGGFPVDLRPHLGRDQSFMPDVPGGWIPSSVPTPSQEPTASLGDLSPREAAANEVVDLTPTTKRVPLREVSTSTPSSVAPNPFDAARNAGSQLGAALMSSVGLGHQTHDFASKGDAAPVDLHDTQSRPARGVLDLPVPLLRQETDHSAAPTSAPSSAPPTPPLKDTPKPIDEANGPSNTSPEDYFPATVAPLRVRPQSQNLSGLVPQLEPRSEKLSGLSTVTSADGYESDRLSKEIVLSLDPSRDPGSSVHDEVENIERIQDALDAPDNMRRIERGEPALPPAEALSTSSIGQPGLLGKRFSWEKPLAPPPTLQSLQPTPEPESPEIKPETEYERPRNKALHVVNTNISVESPVEDEPNPDLSPEGPVPAVHVMPPTGASASEDPIVSPLSKSDHGGLDVLSKPRASSPSQSLSDPASSPKSEATLDVAQHLPSYYLNNDQDRADIEAVIPPTASDTGSQPSIMYPVATAATANKPSSHTPIPPFRTILAMKSPHERISTYDSTRETFASMNTGLQDWLAGMLAKYPEHGVLATKEGALKALPPIQTSNVGTGGLGTLKRVAHKQSPSFGKLAKQFTGTGSGGGDRNFSSGSHSTAAAVAGNPGSAADDRTSASPGGDKAQQFDMDRMQQRGKDLMKSAGVLGGKAGAGAKGLFAKGRNRLAGGIGSVRGEKHGLLGKERGLRYYLLLTSTPGNASASFDFMFSLPAALADDLLPAPPPANAAPLPAADSASIASIHSASNSSYHTAQPAGSAVDISNVNFTPSAQSTAPPLPVYRAPLSLRGGSSSTTSLPSYPPPALRPQPERNDSENPSIVQSVDSESSLPRRRDTSGTPMGRDGSGAEDGKKRRSRPLSQAFEKFRSRSRTTKETGDDEHRERKGRWRSSRSRPRSLVLSNSNLLKTEEEVASAADIRNPSTVNYSQYTTSTPQRVEAWEVPENVARPPTTPGAENDEQERLGVLPSPAPTAQTFDRNADPVMGQGRRPTLEADSTLAVPSQMGAREQNSAIEASWPANYVQNTPSPVSPTESAGMDSHRHSFDKSGTMSVPRTDAQTALPADAVSMISSEDEAEPVIDEGPQTTVSPQAEAFPRPKIDPEALARYDFGPRESSESPEPPVLPQRPPRQRKASGLASLPSQKRWSQIIQSEPAASGSPVEIGRREADDFGGGSPMTVRVTKSSAASPTVDENDPFERTPVAPKNMWTSNPSQPDTPATLSAKDQIAGSSQRGAEHDDAPSATAFLPGKADEHEQVSRPTSADEAGDGLSEVSAEEAETAKPTDNIAHRSKEDHAISRQSSVSSLDQNEPSEDVATTAIGDAAQHQGEEPVMTSHAVPAGPITPISRDTPAAEPFNRENFQQRPGQGLRSMSSVERLGYEQRFANRAYRQTGPLENRPMSYVPLTRDATGSSVGERLDLAQEEGATVDLSGFTGPPPGAPPYLQHPLYRSSVMIQPTEYEMLRASDSTTALSSSGHSREPSGQPTEGRSRRFSGFFRGKPAVAERPSTAQVLPSPPPASRIADQHGLEDVDPFGMPGRDIATPSPTEEKQNNRRSGIWDAFTGRRMSTVGRPESSRDISKFSSTSRVDIGGMAAESQSRAQESSRKGTLKKQQPTPPPAQPPQRAISSAGVPEPKKKRFSALGSLFKRSGTTGHSNPKQNRLSKFQPQDRERDSRPATSMAINSPSTVSGSVRGYEAYEAMRNRDVSAFQENAAQNTSLSLPPPRSQRPASSSVRPSMGMMGIPPPPQGYYSPASNPTSPSDPIARRLNSRGSQGRLYQSIPEAFRPVEASFNRNVQPIGPPPEHAPPTRDVQRAPPPPNSVGRPFTYQDQASEDDNQQRLRQGSTASDVSMASTAISESGRSGMRPYASLPQVSPIQTQSSAGSYGPPRSAHGRRVGAIGHEMARSPAREYADQQTPWMIGLPPAQRTPSGSSLVDLPQTIHEQNRQSRAGSEYTYIPQQPQYPQTHDPRRYPPPSMANNVYRPQGFDPSGYPPDPRARQQFQSSYGQTTAPPPPPHHSGYPSYQQRSYSAQHDPQYGPPRTDDYGMTMRPASQPRQYSGGARPYHQRTSSGYSGRRDDPALGEEDLQGQMKGSSYPGQEWSPTVSDRNGWD